MVSYSKRVQTVLTDEQYELLNRISVDSGKPVSVLVREAIEKVYVEQEDRERRKAALARLLSMDGPVADWEQMEREIIQGAVE